MAYVALQNAPPGRIGSPPVDSVALRWRLVISVTGMPDIVYRLFRKPDQASGRQE
jgi:hypothetical protein